MSKNFIFTFRCPKCGKVEILNSIPSRIMCSYCKTEYKNGKEIKEKTMKLDLIELLCILYWNLECSKSKGVLI